MQKYNNLQQKRFSNSANIIFLESKSKNYSKNFLSVEILSGDSLIVYADASSE